MIIKKVTGDEALDISRWQYQHPYSFYDSDDSSEGIDELMDGTYYSARDEHNDLIGFYCFGRGAQVPGGRKAGLYSGDNILDFGLGMKPELTGKGRGLSFLQAGLTFARNEFQPKMLRLSVATFNKRAIAL